MIKISQKKTNFILFTLFNLWATASQAQDEKLLTDYLIFRAAERSINDKNELIEEILALNLEHFLDQNNESRCRKSIDSINKLIHFNFPQKNCKSHSQTTNIDMLSDLDIMDKKLFDIRKDLLRTMDNILNKIKDIGETDNFYLTIYGEFDGKNNTELAEENSRLNEFSFSSLKAEDFPAQKIIKEQLSNLVQEMPGNQIEYKGSDKVQLKNTQNDINSFYEKLEKNRGLKKISVDYFNFFHCNDEDKKKDDPKSVKKSLNYERLKKTMELKEEYNCEKVREYETIKDESKDIEDKINKECKNQDKLSLLNEDKEKFKDCYRMYAELKIHRFHRSYLHLRKQHCLFQEKHAQIVIEQENNQKKFMSEKRFVLNPSQQSEENKAIQKEICFSSVFSKNESLVDNMILGNKQPNSKELLELIKNAEDCMKLIKTIKVQGKSDKDYILELENIIKTLTKTLRTN